MKRLLVSAVALIDPDGRVLMAKRPEGKTLAGLWEFPGGKVEEGERPETALIRELKEELGFTCIFISHDLGVVHYICNRIMVMNNGKIEETGTADEIYFHPKSSYTQKLIESIPKVNF